jgi:HK97 family phage major capsid protein
MSIAQITNTVNEIAKGWEQLKAINDRREHEVKSRGSADPLTMDNLSRINEALDKHQRDLNDISTALGRPRSELHSAASPSAVTEHKRAFCDYIRKGNEQNLAALEQKALSTSRDNEGGYLITHYMSEHIAGTVREISPMRQLATVTSISADALEIVVDNERANAGWAAEEGERRETETPKINKALIPAHELYAQPKATQKLIDDAKIDIEKWLADSITETFTRMENDAFINGDGQGKPRGILSYQHGTEWGKIEQIKSGLDSAITVGGLIRLFYSLKEEYAVKGKFLMNRETLQAVRMLKDDSTGRYLWQPSLAAGQPDVLMGAEVVQAADMPGLGKGNLAIAFADFATAYHIVDRQDVSILRDPYTEKPYVKFYATKRVGGDVTNFRAIKLLKLAA